MNDVLKVYDRRLETLRQRQFSPLLTAARDGDMCTVQCCVADGADVSHVEHGYTALELAIVFNHMDIFNYLLEVHASTKQ